MYRQHKPNNEGRAFHDHLLGAFPHYASLDQRARFRVHNPTGDSVLSVTKVDTRVLVHGTWFTVYTSDIVPADLRTVDKRKYPHIMATSTGS